MDALEYEQQGFVKGVTARTKSTGYNVLLVSSPKNNTLDGKPRVWVAMEFDTHVRYLAVVEDLELV
jgi:hypothetical protein